jgi:hypothetical protein
MWSDNLSQISKTLERERRVIGGGRGNNLVWWRWCFLPLGNSWAALFVITTEDLHLIGSEAWGGRGPLHLSSRLCQMNEIKVLELSRPGENQTCKDIAHDHYHHHCFTCNMFNSAILVHLRGVSKLQIKGQFCTTTLWEACSTPIHPSDFLNCSFLTS